jgi:hypothetical protein
VADTSPPAALFQGSGFRVPAPTSSPSRRLYVPTDRATRVDLRGWEFHDIAIGCIAPFDYRITTGFASKIPRFNAKNGDNLSQLAKAEDRRKMETTKGM